MKHSPILFSSEMVRAILDGRKTQTRRIVKNQPTDNKFKLWHGCQDGFQFWSDNYEQGDKGTTIFRKSPYGTIGDQLWVRETWKISSFMEGQPIEFQYKDGVMMEELHTDRWSDYEDWYERVCIQSTDELADSEIPCDDEGYYTWDRGKSPLRWRPSIFMPRWASRITLEVKAVRVERLQEISECDAVAEGLLPCGSFSLGEKLAGSARHRFRDLWNSLNGKPRQDGVDISWDANPWVWVVDFSVCEV